MESSITLKRRKVNRFLACSLCAGYLKEAHTIVECLHTFCRSCILKHFAEGNCMCPLCDIDLGPQPRSKLMHDRILQSVVNKVFPHLDEEDAQKGTCSPLLEAEFNTKRGIKRKLEDQGEQHSRESTTIFLCPSISCKDTKPLPNPCLSCELGHTTDDVLEYLSCSLGIPIDQLELIFCERVVRKEAISGLVSKAGQNKTALFFYRKKEPKKQTT